MSASREKVPGSVAHAENAQVLPKYSAWVSTPNRVATGDNQGQLDQGFRRTTPRKQMMGFLEMTLTYKPRPTTFIAPVATWEAMEQHSECGACDTHYASVGAAFFCPACGHNSAVTTLEGALATIRCSRDQSAPIASRKLTELSRAM